MSRWLLWLATNTTGPLSPARRSRPSISGLVVLQASGVSTPRCRTRRAAWATWVRAQPVGNSRGGAGGSCAIAERGVRDRPRQSRPPVSARTSLIKPMTCPHRTSAIASGGVWW
ncbi:hypothetical protein [Phytohabitans rumicis]|uniref:hypothetical protein n=1 Tax=Phytohabitans rumicis TaxID=1076125 RepID=UPI001FE62304|nr:hypothetical protein [Phytohabitans rumicis]